MTYKLKIFALAANFYFMWAVIFTVWGGEIHPVTRIIITLLSFGAAWAIVRR